MKEIQKIKDYLWYHNHPLVFMFYIVLTLFTILYFILTIQKPFGDKIEPIYFWIFHFLILLSLYFFHLTKTTNPGIITE